MVGMSASEHTASPELSTGSHIVIFGENDEPRSAIVVQVRDGLIWISGTVSPGEPDERVSLLYSVPGDAQYWSTARVELLPPETLALRRTGPWSRRQRRAHVRLTTHGIDLEVSRFDARRGAESEKLPMLDVSVGGALGRAAGHYEVDEHVECSFELPEVGLFDLDARVVRTIPGKGSNARNTVAFSFQDVGPMQQSRLRRWIFAEEARRYRNTKLSRGSA